MQIIKALLGKEKYFTIKNNINITARKNWFRAVYKDFKNNRTVLFRQKIWSYRYGFLSYRINQLDLTKDNIGGIISDFDYMKLYPINNRFMFWIDDKLTMKYVLSKYSEFLPEYYFHLTKRNPTGVLKLMDCPDDYPADLEGVINLLKSRSNLAVKPLAGALGAGFYKLTCRSGEYCINGLNSSEKEVYKLLESMDNHIVTEYVEMHEDFKKIYVDSLNTIRLTIINENGDDPIIASAYIRFGTKRSGVVDNTLAGGICCNLDIINGGYWNGFTINENHQFVFCKTHPDTTQKLEGIVPQWENICDNILKICKYIPQLEYMGFDVAVTPEGFKIIEINSHQGINRSEGSWNEKMSCYFSRLIKRRGIKTKNGF